MVKALLDIGILSGSLEDVLAAELGAIFLPHGLGHFIGCDTHDVGGYLSNTPPRPTAPGVNKLRTARTLEAGMVITVEPGCYFINILLRRARANPAQSRFINEDTLQRFMRFGGVRLEDVVVITDVGFSNLVSNTKCNLNVYDSISTILKAYSK